MPVFLIRKLKTEILRASNKHQNWNKIGYELQESISSDSLKQVPVLLIALSIQRWRWWGFYTIAFSRYVYLEISHSYYWYVSLFLSFWLFLSFFPSFSFLPTSLLFLLSSLSSLFLCITLKCLSKPVFTKIERENSSYPKLLIDIF